MRAFSSTSVAPLARCSVSSRDSTSGQRGATSTRSSKPITFIARAAAPTLPAWLVLSRTKRVFTAPIVAPSDAADSWENGHNYRRHRRPAPVYSAIEDRAEYLPTKFNQLGIELKVCPT